MKKTAKEIKEKKIEIPDLVFPICIKQGDSYFRYHNDGRFEHISVKISGLNHLQTSYSFGKLTWLSDYQQEIKTIIRRHGEISQQDFLKIIERYFNYEHGEFFKEKEIQSENLKPEYNYFPENDISNINENINLENDAAF